MPYLMRDTGAYLERPMSYSLLVTVILSVRIIIKQNASVIEILCQIFHSVASTVYTPTANNRLNKAIPKRVA